MEGLAPQDKSGFQARTSEHICAALYGSRRVWAAQTEAVVLLKTLLEMLSAAAGSASGAPVSAQELFWSTALGLTVQLLPQDLFPQNSGSVACLG